MILINELTKNKHCYNEIRNFRNADNTFIGLQWDREFFLDEGYITPGEQFLQLRYLPEKVKGY